jgi:hypothetical protein
MPEARAARHPPRRSPLDADPRVRDLASRLIWWKDPDAALADPRRFLAQAMTDANLIDMTYLRSVVGDETLLDALRHPPAGVFDRRSWTFWHVKLGLMPVPPLPERRL